MPARSTGSATGRRRSGGQSAAGAAAAPGTTGKRSSASSSPPKKKPAAKSRAAKPRAKSAPPKAKSPATTPEPKLKGKKVTVVSVFGTRSSRILIEMSVEDAERFFAELDGPAARPTRVIDAVNSEVAAIGKRKAALAKSQLAATAVALAYELENPYNSATSKSMCARALNETMGTLREMAPAEREGDGIDDLERKRSERRAAVRRSAGA
jgi:hypothetical protein